MLHQRTLRAPISVTGIGLHSGERTTLTLHPALADHGVVFYRSDIPGSEPIPATVAHVVDDRRATTLGVNGTRIGTVEHLLAALAGLGVDNARIEVDGSEVPILDGSAAPFVYLIRTAGLATQRALKRFLMVRRPVQIKRGDSWARISPAKRLSVSCSIEFDHPLISRQRFRLDFSDVAFAQDVCRARTFGFVDDVDQMHRQQLALGGSLDNAVVVDEFHILNPDGLRFPDEFARHKVLDAFGDLALVGMPIVGQYESHRGGHSLNHALVRTLQATRRASQVVEARTPELADTVDWLPGWQGEPDLVPA